MNQPFSADTTFPYRLFRFAHKRSLDSVSSSYFAVVSKDSHPVGLVLMIDIPERWHHAREAATSFWQIYVREFTHSELRSTLTRFEEALKELNKAVVKAQEKIQQSISVSAVVLEGNQIHFSTTGTCRILLARSDAFSDVTAGSDKIGNQFAAVTSGEIDESDIVCVTNQSLYEFLAAEPQDLWKQPSIGQLASEIQSRAQNSQSSLNLVLFQYSANESAQSTLYWEESEKRYPIRLPKFSLPKLPKLQRPELPEGLAGAKLAESGSALWQKVLVSLKSFKRPTKRQLQIAAAAAVVVLGLIWLWQRPHPTQQSVEAQDIVGLISGVAAEDTITFLQEHAAEIAQLSTEQRSALGALLSARGIELTEFPAVISELPNQIVDISPAGDSLFLVDGTGQLWELTSAGQLRQIDHLFKVTQPTDLVAFSSSSLVISDALGNIWHYRGETDGPVAVALPAALASSTKQIAKFDDNLYLYAPEQDGIYRSSGFTGEITATSQYNNLAAIEKTKLHSFTVNGDFVAVVSGQIVSWRRSAQTRSPLPYLFAQTDSTIDAAEDGTIVIQTNNLTTVISPTNELVWQRYFVGSDVISAVALVDKTLWLTAGNSVYSLTL